MKKIHYLVLMLVFTMVAQFTTGQQPAIGLTAGVTMASYKAQFESISVISKIKMGFTVGLVSSIPAGKNFSLQPGLHFSQKGGKLKQDGVTDKSTLNYLELPVNFVYNIHSNKGSFFAGAGPAFSFGLSGKEKWNGEFPGEADIKFGSGDDADFKAFEAGLNFLAGYKFKGGFLIAANYFTGLNNIAPPDDQFNAKYHNRYFGLRLGYMFGNMK